MRAESEQVGELNVSISKMQHSNDCKLEFFFQKLGL